MLTHYTRSPAAIANIVRHGFAWVANRRKLARLLLPQHDFSRREPQQFGMISFTELEPHQVKDHRETFGNLGIVVSDAWAMKHGAQRVIYIDEGGPTTVALKALFEIGYIDVTRRIEYPDDAGWLMAYENKYVASAVVGSTLWAHLLQLWEYLEPASAAAQREWRIVNPNPIYSLSEDKAKAIADASPPEGWAKFMNVVSISRSDVVSLVCPASDVAMLRSQLPMDYQDINFIETND